MVSYTISKSRRAALEPSQAFGLTFSSYSNPPDYIVLQAVSYFPPPPSISADSATTTTSITTPATATPPPASPQSTNTSVSLHAGKPSHDEPNPSTSLAAAQDTGPAAEEHTDPDATDSVPMSTPAIPSQAPPKPAPKSWSALFAKPSSSPPVPGTSTSTSQTELPTQAAASRKTSPPENSQSPMLQLKADPTSLLTHPSLAMLVHPAPLLHPRGLINTGNMCFANSILQVLLYCAPFWRVFIQGLAPLFDEFGTMGSGKNHCALLEATLSFIREFRLAEDVDLPKDPLPNEVVGAVRHKAHSGPTMTIESMRRESFLLNPFVPDVLYDAMRENKRFASMQKGHQEDAEEFLGFLLDTLHEELLFVAERLQMNPTPAFAGTSPSPVKSRREQQGVSQDGHSSKTNEEVEEAREVLRPLTGDVEDGDGWLEVGRKNKVTATRTTKSRESVMTRIFGGKLRSVLRMPGGKTSATLEPYQPLQLDIQPDAVQSIEDAFRQITLNETVSMRSPKGVDVPATKQVFIETLPPILILHIKRFIFDAREDGAFGIHKSQKLIGYRAVLDIPKEVLSPLQRQQPPPRYQLFGVVYHHGKHATGGHYTIDVLRQDHSEWLRIDDTVIEPVAESEVVTLDNRGRRNTRAEGMKVNEVTGLPNKVAYLLFYQRIL